jgi:hypothetical protein
MAQPTPRFTFGRGQVNPQRKVPLAFTTPVGRAGSRNPQNPTSPLRLFGHCRTCGR